MYDWRRMTLGQREETLHARKTHRRPWHSPPHRFLTGLHSYILSAACFEHFPHVAYTAERLDEFSEKLLSTCTPFADHLFAWCVLPNHYHVVIRTSAIKELFHALGQLHGKTAHQWNAEENILGRKVWFNVADRAVRSERHLWSSINYVHHNPVKHGYVDRWQDWIWSSATSFLSEVGRQKATEIWNLYPIKNYGAGWDE